MTFIRILIILIDNKKKTSCETQDYYEVENSKYILIYYYKNYE